MSLLAWLLTGCGALAPEPSVQASPADLPLPAKTPEAAVKVVPGVFVASAVPAALATDVVGGLRFSDANGDNLFVMARSANDDLTAIHAIVEGSRVVQTKRRVAQPRGDCAFDYSSAFVDGATGVTDLDGDGLGEITFAYTYACRSDVSPQDYKLLVLEDGNKAILRGSEILVFPDGETFGDGTFTADGFAGHPTWRTHAETVWRAHATTRLGD